MATRFEDSLRKMLWGPYSEPPGRLKSFFLELLRLAYAAMRDIYEGKLTLRASSLAYTTLVSLIPLLAVSFSVLKAFGIHNQIRPVLHQFLAPLGAREAELTERIMGFVNNVNAGVLGSLGMVTLIYTAFSVVQKTEDSFNYIWRVTRPRSILRSFSDYLSITLVAPVLIVTALGITASLLNTGIVHRLLSIEFFGTAVYIATKLIPYFFVTVAFTFAYILIPNTKVNVKSALTGGVLAGVLWETLGWAFASFTVSSTRYSAIYSGFAIVVLFMTWVYLSWVILLTGAAVSFYHQYPQLLTTGARAVRLSSRPRERLALLIMFLTGSSHYYNTPPWELGALTSRFGLPIDSVLDVLAALTGRGLLIESCDKPPLYLPARDIETITLEEIVNAVRAAGGGPDLKRGEGCISTSEVDAVMHKMDEALKGALKGDTLKTLVLSCKKTATSPKTKMSNESL